MRLSTDFAVRFARGRAWIRPWCEVNHRPLDWASRSLSREFEVVIMVERAIGEMVGSDRVPPERLHANLVGDDEFVQPKRNETAPRSECRVTFKNVLPQPRLLEMDVKPASRTHDQR